MGRCAVCDATSREIAQELGVCLACIRQRPKEALAQTMKAHNRCRVAFGLPQAPPRDTGGVLCSICVHECRIPEGGMGYCGLRKVEGGKIRGGSSEKGKLSWYHDPLPTNCVGDWVCPAGTGAGYPKYAHCQGPEVGYKNLAVFFHSCSFNCLFCQNWTFMEEALKPRTRSVHDLVAAVDERTSCICYFGGDPSPQLPFAIKASKLAMEKAHLRILRICWETNGSMNPRLLDQMTDLSLKSGGCIKFDLKAWDENIHIALTGVTNKRTLENFSRVGEKIRRRKVPPLLIASTLLVPGYIDDKEVRELARFIASIDRDIPYSLLAFYPHFYMADLPQTSRRLAERCLEAAQGEGLKNVRIGNVHLLT